MESLISALRVIHLVNAILMAWPLYALVTVNQRARLGPPLGDRVDLYTGPLPPDVASQVAALRRRRKRLATVCMFVVLTVAMLGLQVWGRFPVWLTLVWILAIAVFTWRSYKSVTPYGWA